MSTDKSITNAHTNQQIGIEDTHIDDPDLTQLVKAWHQAELERNRAKTQVALNKKEKAVRDAKKKALEMLEVNGDGKHRLVFEDGDWGTVLTITPAKPDEDVPASTKSYNPRFTFDNTRAQA